MRPLKEIMRIAVIVSVAVVSLAASQQTGQIEAARGDVEAARQAAMEAKLSARAAQEQTAGAARRASQDLGKQLDVLHQQLYALKADPLAAGRAFDEDILIVPSAQTKPEQIAAMVEDLNIMSRIFDRKLNDAGLAQESNPFFAGSCCRTQAMYIAGYGPLFKMAVNFPLIPPPQVQTKREAEEGDPLWNEMKRTLETPLSSKNTVDQQLYQQLQQLYSPLLPGEQAAPYEQEMVDQLKATLIDALRHVTNVRNFAADERIVIVIKGPQAAVEGQGSEGEAAGSREAAADTDHYLATSDDGHAQSVSTNISRLHQAHLAGAGSASVLTIRAKKSDIDALAKGDLDLEKFTQKVEIFLSYMTGTQTRPTVF